MNSFEYKQKMNNYIKNILMLVLLAVTAYFAHYLVLDGMELSAFWSQSGYSLLGMYAVGAVGSLFALVLIMLTNWAMPKNLGFVFLGIMTIKVIAGYIYIRKGLGVFENDFIEYNFLVVFFLFLFFDVFIAFQALNQEDSTVEKK